MTKDYTLLRPFDLEKAKAGEAFGFIECGDLKPREFIAGPDPSGAIIIKDDRGQFGVSHTHPYHMAPLAWVEGKPVYRGDVLYHRLIDGGTKVTGINNDGDLTTDESVAVISFGNDGLTWTPPKKTREVKLLGWLVNNSLHLCDPNKTPIGSEWLRVPSEDRTVTVEE